MTLVLDFDRTRRIQWDASDPGASAWVVANAGSGKTHVLSQRVLRLLLAGVDPATILCLTFTKIAAAEMARRIFGKLAAWTTLGDAELRAALLDLQGRPPSAEETRQARRLFARALETPGGLKIQTIHAFCESLLHQFPFEANVPGQFTVLDESASAALIEEARAAVLAEAAAGPATRLGAAMRYLAEHATDAQIAAALDSVIAEREAIRRWIMGTSHGGAGSIDDALVDLRSRLGLKPDETEAAICAEICRSAGWARADCAELVAELAASLQSGGNGSDRTVHTALSGIGAAATEIAEAELRLDFFLTQDRDGWKTRSVAHRLSARLRGARAGIADDFASEADRLQALAARLALSRTYAATEALLVVGNAILQEYHAAKRRAGALDFPDLIVKARNLLSRADAAAWVLYKLDARIDHILVDEAQDTSPDQWAVVRATAADFFSGESAARRGRTVFAVGDDKQSIFGFQGAAPHMLADMARFFERAATAGRAGFVRRPLALSFRSTTEVLGAVDAVFTGGLEEAISASGYEAHAANRWQEPGRVVVLPRIVRARGREAESWTDPLDEPTAAEVELADGLAGEVARLRGATLPSGKLLRDGGVLILVRKRDAFVSAMNRALRARTIPLAGADRIALADHIAALDLLAVADVMLLPDDDLQLAAALKTPLFAVDEDALTRLASQRSGSLWAALRESAEPLFRDAAERLARWRGMADRMTPFRFFATLLGPQGGRRAFRERLGGEAEDVLDAFLSQALAYEAVEPPTLQGFLAFQRASRSDIKREVEEGAAGVRVMTVHGAKGLEADVVFLVDTGGQIVVPGHRRILVPVGDEAMPAFLWRRSAPDIAPLQRQSDAVADAATRQEYLRLLYVGMTRARDVLYVCGIRGERTPADCWYSVVEKALVPPDAERDADTGELVRPVEWPQPGRPALAAKERAEVPRPAGEARPEWLARPAPSPPAAPRPLRPSRALGEPDPPAYPISLGISHGAAATPLLRGRALHRLLELLPDVPEGQWSIAGGRLLARLVPHEPAVGDALLGEALAVMRDPMLREVFGPGSRAEVAIVGRLATAQGDYAVSGRIDRLARTAEGWHLLDFKTGGAIPSSLEETEAAHVLQLALYRRLLMDMSPGSAVRATLVWTVGPKIMPVPVETMERALKELGIGETPVP
jgi:ATP-dependent helicase/nuclease subunit A